MAVNLYSRYYGLGTVTIGGQPSLAQRPIPPIADYPEEPPNSVATAPAATEPAAAGESEEGNGRANVALALGAAGLAAGLVALGFALARRRSLTA